MNRQPLPFTQYHLFVLVVLSAAFVGLILGYYFVAGVLLIIQGALMLKMRQGLAFVIMACGIMTVLNHYLDDLSSVIVGIVGAFILLRVLIMIRGWWQRSLRNRDQKDQSQPEDQQS